MIKKYNKEQTLQKWKDYSKLDGYRKAITDCSGKLYESRLCKNGVTYGIVNDGNRFYIKECKTLKENYKASDFTAIIDGKGKVCEKFETYSSAQKRFSTLLNDIDRPFIIREQYEESVKKDQELLNDIDELDKIDQNDATQKPVEEPVQPELQDSAPETSVEPKETPEPAPSEPVSEPTTPEVATPTTPEPSSEIPVEPSTEEIPTEPSGDITEPTAGGDEDKKEGGDSIDFSDVQSLLGKLQSEIQSLESLSNAQTKTVLNTTISATKNGIKELSPEEKDDIADRITKIEEGDPIVESVTRKLKQKMINEAVEKATKSFETKELVRKIVTEQITKSENKHILKEFAKQEFVKYKDSGKSKEEVAKLIRESFEKSIDESLDFEQAVSLTKEFLDGGDSINESPLMDKLRKLSKPLAFAALMFNLGGNVQAASDTFTKMMGSKPSQIEITQGTEEYNKHKEGSDSKQSGDKEPKKGTFDSNDFAEGYKVLKIAYTEESDTSGFHGKLKKATTTIPGDTILVDLRGPNLINKAVIAKSDDQLNENIDSDRLEMAWRAISANVEKALKLKTIKTKTGKVIATNIRQEGDNVVFDFVFENEDSNQFDPSMKPKSILAGYLKIIKPETLTGFRAWVIPVDREIITVNPNLYKENPEQYNELRNKILLGGFENIEGSYNYHKPEKGTWMDVKEAMKEFKDGKIRVNDEKLHKLLQRG